MGLSGLSDRERTAEIKTQRWERGGGAVRRPEGRKGAAAAMAAVSKLAGAARAGTTEPDFANQLHWERERRSRRTRFHPLRGRGELAGARGQGARSHENAMDSVEENAGRERKLTGTTKTARTARNGGFTRWSPAAFFCANREEQRQGEKKMGRGEKARACGGYPTWSRGEGRGERGSGGFGLGSFQPREMKRTAVWGKGWTWRVGPTRQHAREREGREGEAAGTRPRKGARGAVLGQNGRKEGGGRESFFLFIFQTNFSNSFPNEFLNSNSFVQNHSSHKRSAPACMQKNVSLNLYLILISLNLFIFLYWKCS